MNLENYRRLFAGDPSVQGKVYFWQYVLNSLFVTTITVLQTVFCSAAGFALAKYDFRGKKPLMTFMLGSMMIPSVLLLAPLYEMIVKLGLVDTYSALFLPYLAVPYGIFLFRRACSGSRTRCSMRGASTVPVNFTSTLGW
jgi:ABC-type glycerol-3-phosphate transport system permease component